MTSLFAQDISTNSGENIMAFVNEYIPKVDYKKYDFDGLNKRKKERSGSTPAGFWTIDREADIWLREFYVETDHTVPLGGYTGVSVWDFYWKGHLMLAKITAIAGGGGVGRRMSRGKAKSWRRESPVVKLNFLRVFT
jgi:hypothetical protein